VIPGRHSVLIELADSEKGQRKATNGSRSWLFTGLADQAGMVMMSKSKGGRCGTFRLADQCRKAEADDALSACPNCPVGERFGDMMTAFTRELAIASRAMQKNSLL
jgi:hypothetical protein